MIYLCGYYVCVCVWGGGGGGAAHLINWLVCWAILSCILYYRCLTFWN